ncbi:GH25 family lysozyme [Clostridium vincentii]|uniref:Lysozyme n=1 Tax=Clostridium vincentii TaxID=52704 RepID=A0A2T0BJG7_9CLOT|nr:GH25 family lysozyme [Clostridium vincentii]PRR84045.1 Autolytic lysozyme [Clostridium vincentii]
MRGIDVSNHNGIIDFTRVRNSGIELVYMKATEGTTYQDSFLDRNYNGAIGANMMVGFYHFLAGTSLPETQAENFYNQIKNKVSALKPSLDLEVSGFDVINYALRFIKRFEALSNLPIVIYSSPYFINANLDSRLAKYPLWVAHYGVMTPMKNNIWGTSHVGHQYTETGRVDGVNGYCDLNNFYSGIFVSDTRIENPSKSDYSSIVRELQNQINLQGFGNVAVDGIAGNEALSHVPTLRFGAQGGITKAMQMLINEYGYALIPDGIFGQNTRNAVIAFQGSKGLIQDGIVGPNTWSKLLQL